MNEFTARNGLIAQKDSVVTGSLIVTSGITGSLLGTASYAAQALSSSYASAYAAVFPYTGSAIISGSLTVTGSLTQTTTVIAASSNAVGATLSPTLSSSANNDYLVALDIKPSFSSASFTGTKATAIRIAGNLIPSGGYAYNLGDSANMFATVNTVNVVSQANLGLLAAQSLYLGANNGYKVGIFQATGNVTIGSTMTDAGYRLDVQGTSRFNGNSEITGSLNITGSSILQGTTATDAVTLTSELLSTGTGTNWTGTNFTLGYTHTVGSTTPLVATLSPFNGAYYQLVYTISGRTAGSISINFGNYTITGLGNGTTTVGFRSLATTPAFTVTPTTDFDGIIVASAKYINTLLPPLSTYKTSTGVTTIEIRSSTAIQNTLIGTNSGRYLTTGTANTTLGFNAMPNNMTGTNNVSIGALSGIGNTSGANNMFIGSSAGYSNISGQNNCYIGISAGYASTTASSNTFIGTSAGTLNLNGPNTGIGGSSLANNTTGAQNNAIGFQSLFQNTTGNFNDAIGRESGYANTTGGSNIFFGYSSGRYITDGTTANAITNNSIYIGHLTKALANNQTNQIVIGYNTTGLGSNTTVLGNSSTLTTAIYGNTLIGTTTDAGYKFDVQGTSRFNGNSNITGSVTATSISSSAFNPTNITNNYIPIKSGSSLVDSMLYQSTAGETLNWGSNTTPNARTFVVRAANYPQISLYNAVNSYSFNLGPAGGFSFTNGSNNNKVIDLSQNASASIQITDQNIMTCYNGGNFSIGHNNIYTIPSKFYVVGNSIMTGSLTVSGSVMVTGGITGSLLGTASYATQALSASYAPPTFPYTGSAIITGSLTVTGSLNLNDSDISTAWTAYTPVWTAQVTDPVINNGTITGAYKQIGKTVFVRVKINMGRFTTYGDGTWLISLPVTASNVDGIQFPCSLLDNGNAWYTGIVNGTYAGDTTKTAIISTSGGTAFSGAGVDFQTPFAWGDADSLQFNGSYESI
jgi:hypothetical protein